MLTIEEEPTIPQELMAELEESVDRLEKGIRDSELMRQAAEEMDAGREEIRNRLGEMSIAVDLVRGEE
jgi:polyhydroxyalkanoate synthesis regulator phasin